MSSLYNDFNNQPNRMGQMSNILAEFNKFRSTFVGNPEAQVKQLLQTGKMSQSQFDSYAQMANQISQFIKQIGLSFVSANFILGGRHICH